MSERKFIVYESQLDLLLASCQTCGSTILDTKKTLCGSALSVVSVCAEGHRHTWHSQPNIGAMYVGNLLLAAACAVWLSLYHNFIICFSTPFTIYWKVLLLQDTEFHDLACRGFHLAQSCRVYSDLLWW